MASPIQQTFYISTAQLKAKNLHLIGRFVGRRFSASESDTLFQKISQRAHRAFELLKWYLARYLGVNLNVTLDISFQSLSLENTEYNNLNEIVGALIANQCALPVLDAVSKETQGIVDIPYASFLNLLHGMPSVESYLKFFEKLKIKFENDLMVFLEESLVINDEAKREILNEAIKIKGIDFYDAVDFINKGRNRVKKQERFKHLISLGLKCPITYTDRSDVTTIYGKAILNGWGKDVIVKLRELAPFDFQNNDTGVVSNDDIRCFKLLLRYIVDSVDSDKALDDLCKAYKDIFMNKAYKEKVSAALFSLKTVTQLVSDASKPSKIKSKRRGRRRKKPVVNFRKAQNMIDVLVNFGCDLSFVKVNDTETTRLGHRLMLNLIDNSSFLSKNSFIQTAHQCAISYIQKHMDIQDWDEENTILIKKLLLKLGTNTTDGFLAVDDFIDFIANSSISFLMDEEIYSRLSEKKFYARLTNELKGLVDAHNPS